MDNGISQIKKFIENNKFLFNVIKITIFIVSIYFLTTVIYNNFQQIKDFLYNNKVESFIFIVVSAIVYVGLLVILAKAWKVILESYEEQQISNNIVFIYLNSLIYKYLPGNIFHYANRQIAANKIGLGHKTLLKSNLIEAFCLIVSASIFSIILLPRLFANNYVYIIILVLLTFTTLYFKKHKITKIIIKSLPYYLLYFFAIGLISFFVINYLTLNNISAFTCIALYAIAWIAGFVIPGAPGGIGVRESVFILLSNGLINQSDAVIVISLLRISTTLGEIIAYFYARVNYHQSDTLN